MEASANGVSSAIMATIVGENNNNNNTKATSATAMAVADPKSIKSQVSITEQTQHHQHQHRKKSIKMSTIAKSLTSIFSSKNSDEKDKQPSPEKHASFSGELPRTQTSPTKETTTNVDRLSNINEDDVVTGDSGSKRKESSDISMSLSTRRQSRNGGGESVTLSSRSAVGADSFSTTTATSSSTNLSMRGPDLIAQNSSKKNLPVLIDMDCNDYKVEGYAQLPYNVIENLDDEKLDYDEINETDIVETSREYTYYVKHFQRQEHFNFVGKLDTPKSNLYVLSLKYDAENYRYMSILRTKDGNMYDEIVIKDKDSPMSMGSTPSSSELAEFGKVGVCFVMRSLFNETPKEIIPVNFPLASEEIAAYDKQLTKQTFTFGIIYQKHGQISEKEIFSNSENSKEFDDFLDFIGQRVALKNFKKFRGGLDVKDGGTGTESIYEYHDQAEIMFHVSTFLPLSEKDQQYVERKRHIGNDRVAIVFQDRDTLFSPKIIKSKLLHVFMIVQPVLVHDETKRYKITVISKKDVPLYGPLVRRPFIFNKGEKLKNFILSKLINAEYASLRAPAFSVYSEKTLESSLQRMCDSLLQSTRLFLSYPGVVVSTNADTTTSSSLLTSLSSPTTTSSQAFDAAASSSVVASSQSTNMSSAITTANSGSTTSSGSSGFKGALKKVFRGENNPYLAPDTSAAVNTSGSSSRAHGGRKMSTPMTTAEHHYHYLNNSQQQQHLRALAATGGLGGGVDYDDDDVEFINRSREKENTKIGAQKQAEKAKKDRKSSWKSDPSSSFDYHSDSSLHQSALAAEVSKSSKSKSNRTSKEMAPTKEHSKANRNEEPQNPTDSVDDLTMSLSNAPLSTPPSSDSSKREASTIAGVIVSGSGGLVSTDDSLLPVTTLPDDDDEANGVYDDAVERYNDAETMTAAAAASRSNINRADLGSNKLLTEVKVIVAEKGPLETNFVNTFNQEFDELTTEKHRKSNNISIENKSLSNKSTKSIQEELAEADDMEEFLDDIETPKLEVGNRTNYI